MNAGNDLGVVSDGKFFAANNIGVALVKLAEATTLGAFAAEVTTNLSDGKWKSEVVVVLDDIAREWHSVIEAQSLIGLAVVFGGFDDLVDLFFGIATSLC